MDTQTQVAEEKPTEVKEFPIKNVETMKKMAAERRERRKEKEEDFHRRLSDAHDQVVFDLLKELEEITMRAMERGYSFVKVWDPCRKEYDERYNLYRDSGDLEARGFAWKYLMYGFWNPHKRVYDRRAHLKAGVNKTPLEVVTEVMARNGFIVRDISDPNMSHSMVLGITWDEEGAADLERDVQKQRERHAERVRKSA